MPCLVNHRWSFDFRLHYVYRKCQFCNVAERHLRNKEWMYTAWEPVRARTNIEPEQRQGVQKRSPAFVRLAHSLGLMRTKVSDGIRYLT
jgi:hypothetical protein